MSNDPKIAEIFDLSLDKREIYEGTTLADAIDVMKDVKYNCLLVKNKEGRGIGVLSEHDIVTAFAKEGDKAKTASVNDFMTLDIFCAREDDTLNDAIKLMADRNIRYAPVISKNNQVSCFISIMELLMAKMTFEAAA